MSTTPTLRTRKPTGKPSWPTILVEGDEKAGKTWACAVFTGSPRVGQAYWIDLAEGAGDEYASLGNYDLIVHDGTFGSIYEQVTAAKTAAKTAADAGDPPVVLVVDGINALWDSLKDWVTDRARRTKYARKVLAEDPNAEIKPASFLWNDANDRWNRILNQLITFPGIVLITAKGKEVAVMGADGNPIPGQKEWRVGTQKDLGFQVTAWLRLRREGPATVVGVRSVNTEIGFRPGSRPPEPLSDEWTLDWFVFDALGIASEQTQVRDFKPIDAGTDLPPGVEYISAQGFLGKVADGWNSIEVMTGLYQESVGRGIADHDVTLPDGSTWVLGEFIQQRGVELMASQPPAAPPAAPATAQQAPAPAPPAAPPAQQAPTAPTAAQPPAAAPADQVLEQRLKTLTKEALEATTTEQLSAIWRANKDVLDHVLPVRGDKLRDLLLTRQRAIAAEAAS